MPLNIGSQFHRKTIRHIVMKSLQPDPEFSGSFRFIVAQIMTQYSQPNVQKPEQPDALISGTVTAMRTIGYPVKPVRNRTAFGVRDTQNDSAVMLKVNHDNAMTLTPPYSRTKLLAAALMRCSPPRSCAARRRAHALLDHEFKGRPKRCPPRRRTGHRQNEPYKDKSKIL
jgi:hypothetical protein